MELKQSLGLIAPEILLSIASLVLLLVSAWAGDKASRAISVVACFVLGACFFIVAPTVCAGVAGPDVVAFNGLFTADAFSGFAKLLIFAATGAALVMAPKFFERTNSMMPEFPVLILLAALGMCLMVSATDLMTLYIGLELNSLASYVLAAFLRNDERSAEAGIKYFVLGALASGILLFGMSLTYGFTGSTDFGTVRAALTGDMSTGAMFAVVFVLAGLAFKISAVPFHMWTPDVYEGSPTPVTAFFATAPKVAAVSLLMRVSLDAFGMQADAWRQIVLFVALASIVVGALGAIGQSNIKRLMAFSSINNVGFILIGLVTGTVQGASAMLVYLAIYIAMTAGSFLAIIMMKDEAGAPVEKISDIAGLSRTKPALALCLAMMMFSLAGIPPLFGFWGKFVVFQAAVEANLVALAAIGIAASVIGAFYYLKIVKVMYFDEPADVVKGQSDWAHWALLIISTAFISPLGYLLTTWLGGIADKAAATLFLVAA
ncbi:NADH-quinone oxidoreductase subunit NuoN [Altererythrobacter indicus]|uniref:NADH-quinone oxidoreductase subunit N n=1 Tax=Altericroceibacterium indicum TaxID=374177 RepID=A0A845A531_9SPHN|nr:NADH-quinone oxidoreductase subunit NuoN [Altericroceibacterium indicum]MXP25300.1 NADH-quinone oxidoreductase subunit NuoN [Altericroceibacterium indicum]